MGYSDSHAHMADYDPEMLGNILELMREKDVELVLNVGVNLDIAEKTIEIAARHENIIATVGIHPWFAEPLTDVVEKHFSELASSKYVKALGEIGLDYDPPVTPPPGIEAHDAEAPTGMPKLPDIPPTPEVQKELLMFELSQAIEYGLPVNIHCRAGAHKDMIDIISGQAKSGLTGIAHDFEGGMQGVNQWLDLGFYIALGPHNLTVEPIPDLNDVVRAIPLDRLVTQTDANPMMNPENGPVDVIEVVRIIAEIRNMSPDEIGRITTDNLRRVLKL